MVSFALASLLFCQLTSAAVLSIDYGTEWTKAALVKPGIPLEIVLTKDTKRKEQSVIAFKGDERLYGGDAANMGARTPEYTFPALKTLLGQSYDSEAAKEYSLTYPAVTMQKTARDTIAFKREGELLTVEDLVAMELINMRKNAELMADSTVRDAILTVPSSFEPRQRASLLSAAHLAGLRPLELLNDGVAVAIDFAKARSFEVPQVHVIFDMGAGSTSATVVKLSTVSVKDYGRVNKTVTSIEVLGSSSTTRVGGDIMSQRIYNLLLDTFEENMHGKTNSPLSSNPRASARLLKESTRIKQILSANNEATITVESLHEDFDFRHKLTRTTFEELNSDLLPLTTKVVKDAIDQAGISAAEIESLILHGGAARVPFVQAALVNVVSESQIARNVNADEAAVMGAVFRGAGLSGSFRVKDIRVQDHSPVSYFYKTEHGHGDLFSAWAPLGSQKNVTLQAATTDLELTIYYQLNAKSELVKFSDVKIQGIAEATSQLKDLGCPTVDITIALHLDHSGLVSIDSATANCEIDERPGVADKVKGWFGSKESGAAHDGSDTAANASATGDASTRKVYKRQQLKANFVSSLQISEAELTASLKKIEAFEQIDNDRVALDTARNGLEAYIYKVRDLLDMEDFTAVASATEQKALQELAVAANLWLNEEAEGASLPDFVSRKDQMTNISDRIILRKTEAKTRPSSIEALRKQIATSRTFAKTQLQKIATYKEQKAAAATKSAAEVASAQSGEQSEAESSAEKGGSTDPDDASSSSSTSAKDNLFEPIYNEIELQTLIGKIEVAEEWLSDKIAEQSKLNKFDDPVLRTSDMEKRTTKITEDLNYLLRKGVYAEQAKLKSTTKPKSRSAKASKKSKSTQSKNPDSTSDSTQADKPQSSATSAEQESGQGEKKLQPESVVEESEPEPESGPVPVAENPLRDEL